MISTQVWYIILIVSITLLVRYHWKRRRLYSLSWSLHGSISLPIIGDAYQLICKDEDILDVATKKIFSAHPSPIKFWFGPKFSVLFTDPKQVEKVMSSMKFAYKDKVYRFMKPFHGESLISGSGPKWKSDRRLIAPLFADRRVEQYFQICVRHANVLVDILKEKLEQSTFDTEIYLHRCAADIVTESFMGVKLDAQLGMIDEVLDTINRMYILVHSRIVKVWLHSDFIFNLLGYGKIQEEGRNIIHGFLRKCLEVAKTKHKANSYDSDPEAFQSILDQMLSIRDDIPHFATDDEMVEQLTALYTASEDTITIICSFALVLFGMYPKIQNKVFDELVEVLGPKPRYIELEDMSKFDYMLMCIKEVMRLFPIAPFIMREASEDVQIDRWVIPKGCSVLVSIHNCHRNPQQWEKPDDFYPEHFLPEAVNKRHPYAFMPFSAGPRGCIGKPFAYMAIKTVLATVLQAYEIEADGTLQERKIKADITVRFKDGGYPIRLKRRLY